MAEGWSHTFSVRHGGIPDFGYSTEGTQHAARRREIFLSEHRPLIVRHEEIPVSYPTEETQDSSRGREIYLSQHRVLLVEYEEIQDLNYSSVETQLTTRERQISLKEVSSRNPPSLRHEEIPDFFTSADTTQDTTREISIRDNRAAISVRYGWTDDNTWEFVNLPATCQRNDNPTDADDEPELPPQIQLRDND